MFSNKIIKLLPHLRYKLSIRTCTSKVSALKAQSSNYDSNDQSYLFVSGKVPHDIELIPYYNLKEIQSKLDHYANIYKLRYNFNYTIDKEELKTKLQNLIDIRLKLKEIEDLYPRMKHVDLHLRNNKPNDAFLNDNKPAIEQYLDFRNQMWDLEEFVYPILVRIPNDIHETTPLKENQTIYQYSPSLLQEIEPKDHVEVATKLGLLKFSPISPTSYFLLNQLSILEIKIGSWFANYFNKKEFSPITCPDFVNSLIVEGVGTTDPKAFDKNIILCDDELSDDRRKTHLVGTSSIESLCAFLTKINVLNKSIPLKKVAYGRHYNPLYKYSETGSLYNLVQYNCVRFFIGSDKESDENQYTLVLDNLKECYNAIGLPYRIVKIAAPFLPEGVSLKLQVELYSSYLKDYIPCGDISCYNDFISKRLNMTYGNPKNPQDFLFVTSGVAVNIPILIGILLENNHTEKSLLNLYKLFNTS